MHNYLKYWRVVRYFIKAKYGLTQADLDMLLFLESEKFFSKDDFDSYNELKICPFLKYHFESGRGHN